MTEHTIVILVVDDERDDCQRMSEALEKEGYLVLQAANSTHALKEAEAQRRKIDLLITDISLPGTNGCELAKQLLKRYPELKTLFVSGYVGSEVCRYYGIPITDLFFLRKPFENSELVTRVHQVLESPERVPLKPANGDAEPEHDSV